MPKTLLVFDIDDTLTKTAAIHIEAFITGLRALGVQEMDTDFGAYLHHTDSYISRVIYEKDLKREFTQINRNAFETFIFNYIKEQSIVEIRGASQLIRALEQDKNIAIAYATGSLLKPALLKLDLIGANYDPLQLVASNTIEERENIVSKAIEQAKEVYKVEGFQRIISIGDGLWDLKTADNLGIEFIGIGEKNKEMMKQNGLRSHFEDLTTFHF